MARLLGKAFFSFLCMYPVCLTFKYVRGSGTSVTKWQQTKTVRWQIFFSQHFMSTEQTLVTRWGSNKSSRGAKGYFVWTELSWLSVVCEL